MGDMTMSFTDAKSRLSSLMDEVVHSHRPKVIDRHQGREVMVALPAEDAHLYFQPSTTPLTVDFGDDEVIVTATALSLIGEGPDIHAALADLAGEIDDFAVSYFERFDYFRHTADSKLAPFLLRFILTSDEDRPALLLEPLRDGQMHERADSPAVQEREAAAA